MKAFQKKDGSGTIAPPPPSADNSAKRSTSTRPTVATPSPALKKQRFGNLPSPTTASPAKRALFTSIQKVVTDAKAVKTQASLDAMLQRAGENQFNDDSSTVVEEPANIPDYDNFSFLSETASQMDPRGYSSATEAKILKLEEDLKAAQHHALTAEKQLADVRAEVKEKDEKLAISEKAKRFLKEDLEATEQELDKLRQQRGVTAVEMEGPTIRGGVGEGTLAVDLDVVTFGELKVKFKELTDYAEMGDRFADEANKVKRELRERVQSLESQVQRLVQEIDGWREDYLAQAGELEDAEKKAVNLKGRLVVEQNSTQTLLDAQESKHYHATVALEKRIKTLAEENATLKDDLTAGQNSLKESFEQKQKLESENVSFAAKLAESEGRRVDLEYKLLLKGNDSSLKEVEDLKGEIEELKKKVSEVEEKRQDAMKEKREALRLLRESQQENIQKSAEVGAMEEKLDDRAKELDHATNEIRAKDDKIAAAQATIINVSEFHFPSPNLLSFITLHTIYGVGR